MKNNKQTGFTLVELIVVIVILGILAATALPKFIDLSSDARSGVMKGVEGAMRGSAIMIYGKAAAGGQLGPTGSVLVNSIATATVCGYPASAAIGGLLDLNPTSDFDVTSTATATTIKHTGAPNGTTSVTCQVVYTPPVLAAGVCPSPSVATYVATLTGC